MKKIISAGIIIFRHTPEGIKYLLLYHGRGYWNFPKGKMEQSERSVQTAFREIREETGIKAAQLKLHPNFKTFQRFVFGGKGSQTFKIVILYLAESTTADVFISSEHEGFGWFTLGESQRVLIKYPETLRILKKVHSFLKKPVTAPIAPVLPSTP